MKDRTIHFANSGETKTPATDMRTTAKIAPPLPSLNLDHESGRTRSKRYTCGEENNMKCISLWQPWASLMAVGSKTIETRSWYTPYRGPLLIHAAKRKVIRELEEIANDPAFDDGLMELGGASLKSLLALPYGAIVAQVELIDCRRTESFDVGEILDDYPYGNFEPGRFGWVCKDAKRWHPVEYRGQQGLFDVDIDLVCERILDDAARLR